MTQDTEERTVRPFAAVIQEHRDGALHAELSEELQNLVAEVLTHGKAGSLTLVVDVKPADKGLGSALIVAAEIKTKPPKGERPAAIFFPDAEGNLFRRDPRQPELPLREAPAGPDHDALREAQR
jgi:hypothetical protein